MSKKTEAVSALIKKAFIELMNKKYYMDITVTDVVNEAGVARASFYRNFKSTNDILESLVDDITADIEETLLPVFSSDDEESWREFLFNLIYIFRSRQKKLIINYPTNIPIILEKMNDHLVYSQDSIHYTNIREKYYLIARFGLIFMVLKGWTDSGMKESPEDLINYLMSLILAI